MDVIQIRGGRRLKGEVTVGGAKNAALPILLAALLTPERCTFRNLPRVVDVRTTLRLLADLGAKVEDGDAAVSIQAERLARLEAQYELVKTMRASFLSLGPLLARFGRARVSTPGGCAIGSRPVDLHLDGLQKMGARVRIVSTAAGADSTGAASVINSPKPGAGSGAGAAGAGAGSPIISSMPKAGMSGGSSILGSAGASAFHSS